MLFYILFCWFIPVLMIGCGFLLAGSPAKEANALYGYRTRRSQLSQAAWDFAQRYCGHIWKLWGAVMLIPSLAGSVLNALLGEQAREVVLLVLISLQTLAMILSIIPVERALKEKFDDNGQPHSHIS